MVQVNFNAQNHEPQKALEALPSGQYKVQIVKSEEKPNSDKAEDPNGSQLVFEFEVLDGEFKGRKLFDRLNTKNKNEQTVEIAFRTLSSICHVTNKLNITDTQQLHGIPMTVVVTKSPQTNDPTRYNNNVRGYKDINGNDPGFAGQTQGGAGASPSWAGGQQGAAANPPPPPPPPPPAAPTADFPPAGWAAHPSAPGFFYKGDEVVAEAELRARAAPPPPPPGAGAPPPPPPPPAASGGAAAGETPPWMQGKS